MSKSKYTNIVCIVISILTVVAAILVLNAKQLGVVSTAAAVGYEEKLFNTKTVHTIDIAAEESDWQEMLDNATSEEYITCDIVIDGESLQNVAIRTKGNSSLTQVASTDSDRFSFKVEFDHYDDSITYYGLDKLCLNNIVQDNTYMKDFLCYSMMQQAGAETPLCSFVWITVNGEDWGLYAAAEGIEDGFAQRTYGSDYGNIYKPDSMDMNAGGNKGGGMGSTDVQLLYTDDSYDSYDNIFSNAVFDVTDSDKDRLISSIKQLNEQENLEEILDTEEIISYFVAHNFVLNGDSYTGNMIHNYYLRENDGVLSMIAWDYNLAFGGMSMGGSAQGTDQATSLVNSPIDSPVTSGDIEDRPMVSWIFSQENYTEAYHKAFADFISSYFESGYFEELFDETIEMISPYVEKDPTAFCTYEEFQSAAETLKKFCLLRAESVKAQLDGTIPSTSSGQAEDSSNLIDASSLDISVMGSNSFGGARGKTQTEIQDSPESEDGFAGFQSRQGAAEDSLFTAAADMQSPPELPDGAEPPTQNGQMMPPGQEQNGTESTPRESESGDESQADESVSGSTEDSTETPAQDENTQQPPDFGDLKEFPDGDAGQERTFPGGDAQASSAQGQDFLSWLLFGGSVLLLGIGLVIAKLYKR